MDKTSIETIINKYHEEKKLIRVGTILGDSTNNQISGLFEKKMVLGISGSDSLFVFVWDQDVVNCLIRGIIVKSRVRGVID